MFARIITFKMKPGTVDEIRKLTEESAIPWLRGLKGFHGIHVIQTSDTEAVVFEMFETKEDAEAIRSESEQRIKRIFGHLLATPPSYSHGEIIVHGAGHKPHHGPGISTAK